MNSDCVLTAGIRPGTPLRRTWTTASPLGVASAAGTGRCLRVATAAGRVGTAAAAVRRGSHGSASSIHHGASPSTAASHGPAWSIWTWLVVILRRVVIRGATTPLVVHVIELRLSAPVALFVAIAVIVISIAMAVLILVVLLRWWLSLRRRPLGTGTGTGTTPTVGSPAGARAAIVSAIVCHQDLPLGLRSSSREGLPKWSSLSVRRVEKMGWADQNESGPSRLEI
jgi:hypothetical protein